MRFTVSSSTPRRSIWTTLVIGEDLNNMAVDPSVFRTSPIVNFGAGQINNLAEEVKFLGGKKVFIVTDEGLRAAGLVDKAEAILAAENIDFQTRENPAQEPSVSLINHTADEMREYGADVVIGLGGGSSMDTSQIAGCAVTNRATVEEIIGVHLVKVPGLPNIAIPTTAGTASEVTGNAVTVLDDSSNKQPVISPHIYPDVAIVDPELTLGLPARVTAASGIDAFCHATESFLSTNATVMTKMFARESMGIILENLPVAYSNGTDISARTGQMMGALLAGYTLANAGVTIIHATAHVIGARYKVPHGIANAICLVPVFRFYAQKVPDRMAELAGPLGVPDSVSEPQDRADRVINIVEKLVSDIGIDTRLSTYGILEDDIPEMARLTAESERLQLQSPAQATSKEVESMLRAAF